MITFVVVVVVVVNSRQSRAGNVQRDLPPWSLLENLQGPDAKQDHRVNQILFSSGLSEP